MDADGVAADRADLLTDVLLALQLAKHRRRVRGRLRVALLSKGRLVDLGDHILRERLFQVLFALAFQKAASARQKKKRVVAGLAEREKERKDPRVLARGGTLDEVLVEHGARLHEQLRVELALFGRKVELRVKRGERSDVDQLDVLGGERDDELAFAVARFVGSAQHDEGEGILRW